MIFNKNHSDPIMSDPSVLGDRSTPTKNRFQVLDKDLQPQYEQGTSKELMILPDVLDGHNSDGVGTKDVVTIRVPFLKSIPNSDEELPLEGVTKKRNNKAKGIVGERRFTRSIKGKIEPLPKQ